MYIYTTLLPFVLELYFYIYLNRRAGAYTTYINKRAIFIFLIIYTACVYTPRPETFFRAPYCCTEIIMAALRRNVIFNFLLLMGIIVRARAYWLKQLVRAVTKDIAAQRERTRANCNNITR